MQSISDGRARGCEQYATENEEEDGGHDASRRR